MEQLRELLKNEGVKLILSWIFLLVGGLLTVSGVRAVHSSESILDTIKTSSDLYCRVLLGFFFILLGCLGLFGGNSNKDR